MVHATVLCGLATQTSSTGSAMASSDRAAAEAPATTARRRSGHPCRAVASEVVGQVAGAIEQAHDPFIVAGAGSGAGRARRAAARLLQKSADADGPVPSGEGTGPSYRLGVQGQPRSFMISRMRSAVADGVLPTLTPAASRASCLAAAVPEDPDTIAPAWPIVLPSGAVKPAT